MNFDDLRTVINIMDKFIVDCLVFFLIIVLIYSLYVTDMQKREWCYAYLRYDFCVCQDNPEILINRSLTIDPYKVYSPLDQMNENQRKEFEETWIPKLNSS